MDQVTERDKHKDQVDQMAIAAFVVHANLTKQQAKAVVTALARCQIPSAMISY